MSRNNINLTSDYHFILNYSADDINGIISDIELSKEGYEFLYAIDTYDILENYLPYTQVELFSKKDQLIQAQKFICYDYFFGEINKTNTILLNEYRIELIAAKNRLHKHLSETYTVLRNLEDLKKNTSNFLNNTEQSEAFFRNYFEVILLLLILNDKTDKNNILDEFFSFIRYRLDIDTVRVHRKSDTEKVNAIFEESVCTKFTIELFEAYIQQNKKHLLSVENSNQRYVFLENTFRDTQVIERILRVNYLLEEQGLKYSMIYLSSARKTKEIYKAIDLLKISDISNFTFPKKNTHRNIYQYFLFDRLKNDFKDQPDTAISILVNLREIIVKLNNSSIPWDDNSLSKEKREVLQLVKKLYDERSSVLDNHFYFSVYEKYRPTFKKARANGETTKSSYSLNKEDMIQILRKVEKKKDFYKSKIYNLELTMSQINQTYRMVDTYWGIENFDPEFKYGKDIIRNPYHHLPVLPLIDICFNSPLKKQLISFLYKNIEVCEIDAPENSKIELKSSLNRVISELTSIDYNEITNRFLESFITTYINFVAQSKKPFGARKDQQKNSELLEESIILDLEKQYELVKYYNSKIDLDNIKSKKKIDIKLEHHQLLTEIMYVLLWLYRRNQREDVGIQKIKENLEGHSDPRIFHGLGLCYISKLYYITQKKHEHSKSEEEFLANLAIQQLHLAKEKYKLLFTGELNTETSFLVIKNYIAVLNSISDLNIRKYEKTPEKLDFPLLETARLYINEIKKLFHDIHLVYRYHLTYVATEIELEVLEAEYYLSKGQINKAHEKIIFASELNLYFKSAKKTKILVDERFRISDKRINNLTNKIINLVSKKKINGYTTT